MISLANQRLASVIERYQIYTKKDKIASSSNVHAERSNKLELKIIELIITITISSNVTGA